jgi:YD repeat-containing protein
MRYALLLALAALTLSAQTQYPIDCNQPADVNFIPGIGKANLQFSATAGEAIYFRFVAVSADEGFGLGNIPVISDAFGNVNLATIRNQNPTVPGATPADMALLTRLGQGFEWDFAVSSSFTMQLVSNNAALAGTLHIEMVRLNRPCANNVTLGCGKAAAGAIAASTATSPPLRPGQIDTYKYEAQAGDLLSFRLLRTASSGQIDTNTYFVLAIYGPDAHALNADPKTNRLTLVPIYNPVNLTITTGGTLTLLVFEPTGGRGGNYYLSVSKLNGGCGGSPSVSCGSVQDGQLTSPLALGSYTISAVQGDVWQIRVARASTASSFSPFFEVYDSTGTRLGSAGPAAASGHAVSVTNVTFPATATYTILVGGPLDGSTGGYTLSTTRLNKPCAEQPLGCSTIVDGSVSGLLRSHVYSLAASAGDNYLIRLLQPDGGSLFRPRVDIFDPTGGQVMFVNTSDTTRQTFTVPGDGTYTVIVTDSFDGSQSGKYSLGLLRLNRPCNATVLNCGAPAAGNLARSLDNGVFSYTAAEGDSFSVRMLPTGGVLPSLEIYDSQGNRTGQALTGTFTGVDVVKPPAGSYTVVAADNSKNPGTGSFMLDLIRTKNACGQPIVQGRTVNGVVSAAVPLTAFTLQASQDDLLTLRSASSTPGFSAQMEMYDPEGNRVDTSVFGLSRKATASGTYTVIVGPSAPRTAGGYVLAWQALNKPVNTVPLACGATTAGALAGSQQFRYYSVAADAGDTLRMLLTKTSDNFAPQIELFDPSGTRLVANSDVTQKVTAGGNYLAIVSPSTTAFESGSYTLAYQRPNNPCTPASLTCGQTTLRQVTLPGQLDTLTFNGTGGDLTTIRFTPRSGNYSPFVELYNAAGTRLLSTSGGQIRQVLTADGTYTLLVRDRGATNTGSYRVSLQDDTLTCPVNDGEAPAISLVRPTGGEVVPGGSSFRIQWLSDDNVGVSSHDIALSTDGGKTFATSVASGLNGNQQTFDWAVPSDVAPSRNAMIRVTATDAAGNSSSATSDLLTLIGSGFTPNASATYSYDAAGRLTQVKLDDGRVVRYTYDAAGNLVQVSVQ